MVGNFISERLRSLITNFIIGKVIIMGKFEGKSVFLTGGSTGIGRQTALDFAREGAMVTIFDINEEGGSNTA